MAPLGDLSPLLTSEPGYGSPSKSGHRSDVTKYPDKEARLLGVSYGTCGPANPRTGCIPDGDIGRLNTCKSEDKASRQLEPFPYRAKPQPVSRLPNCSPLSAPETVDKSPASDVTQPHASSGHSGVGTEAGTSRIVPCSDTRPADHRLPNRDNLVPEIDDNHPGLENPESRDSPHPSSSNTTGKNIDLSINRTLNCIGYNLCEKKTLDVQGGILDNNNTDSKSQGLHSRTGSSLVSPTQNTVPSSPTHQEPVKSADVVNSKGHLGSGKTVSGTRSDHSGSDTSRSVPGESGSVLKRIKSLLGSPSSKESGDPGQSSGSNGSTKRGQNSRSPKRRS
ncbi:hypothetical protein RRG08_027402 [Elysia crispata]|uniref:Uncharacterized protein n=1 Tax=Elysia crispata TaxID=231223 RepID=A0AAE1CY87_9GAST|nr:hypothetical protein RRG08_027402 [Elysia crispata]